MTAHSKVFSLVEATPGRVGPCTAVQAEPGRRPNRQRQDAPLPLLADKPAPGLRQATVLAGQDGEYRLELVDGAAIVARRAAGCLLRPEPGDTVLVHLPQSGQAYVLSVLERGEGPAVLDAAGALRIEAAGSLDLAADELRLRGRTGRFDFLCLSVLVGALTAKAGRIATVAAALDSRIGDLTQKVRLAVRQVDTEVVRAGGLRQFIRDRFLVRAGRADVLADESVTVDAKKIHLG